MAIRLTGMASGLDTDSMVQELVSAYSTKLETYEKQKTKLEWKQETWKDLNSKVYSFYTGSLSSLRLASSFANKKSATLSDSTKGTVSATSSAPNGTQTVKINALAKATYYTGSKINTAVLGDKASKTTNLASIGINNDTTINFHMKDGTETDADGKEVQKYKDVSVTVNGTDTIEELLTRIKEKTGLNASFDTNSQRFIINGESGAANDFEIQAGTINQSVGTGEYDEEGNEIMETQTVADANSTAALTALGLGAGVSKQTASDAEFEINGAEYTSTSNSITVNGLTINATGVSDNVMTVNVATDTDGIYNMIRDFFSDYNTLVNELTKDYNADNAKDYEPLTDDEKESMSDTEIEKWEKKIKDSLLRRDDTLNSIISAMTTALASGVSVNGKTYYLSSFGIQTLGFTGSADNEYNAYHIDGDSKDSNSADNTDKLRAMIESDPETVQAFFTGLAQKVYDNLHTKMLSTTLRSAYTVYNDKQLDTEMKNIKSTISDWEDKVADYEDKWYDKFSAMETALTKLQSQTSQLTSLLGGS